MGPSDAPRHEAGRSVGKEIVLRGAGAATPDETLRDPDGHLIRFEADGTQAAR